MSSAVADPRAIADRLTKDLLALCSACTVSVAAGVRLPGRATKRHLPALVRHAADLCAACGVDELELEGPRQLAAILEGKR